MSQQYRWSGPRGIAGSLLFLIVLRSSGWSSAPTRRSTASRSVRRTLENALYLAVLVLWIAPFLALDRALSNARPALAKYASVVAVVGLGVLAAGALPHAASVALSDAYHLATATDVERAALAATWAGNQATMTMLLVTGLAIVPVGVAWPRGGHAPQPRVRTGYRLVDRGPRRGRRGRRCGAPGRSGVASRGRRLLRAHRLPARGRVAAVRAVLAASATDCSRYRKTGGLNLTYRSNWPNGRFDISRLIHGSMWNPRPSRWRMAVPLRPGTSSSSRRIRPRRPAPRRARGSTAGTPARALRSARHRPWSRRRNRPAHPRGRRDVRGGFRPASGAIGAARKLDDGALDLGDRSSATASVSTASTARSPGGVGSRGAVERVVRKPGDGVGGVVAGIGTHVGRGDDRAHVPSPDREGALDQPSPDTLRLAAGAHEQPPSARRGRPARSTLA